MWTGAVGSGHEALKVEGKTALNSIKDKIVEQTEIAFTCVHLPK